VIVAAMCFGSILHVGIGILTCSRMNSSMRDVDL
jgi:hypothetical protein